MSDDLPIGLKIDLNVDLTDVLLEEVLFTAKSMYSKFQILGSQEIADVDNLENV